MSPRRAPALRAAAADATLRDHLIGAAAGLIGNHPPALPTVRDIARQAQVADGVLYNHFADKHELLAEALLKHVEDVMSSLVDLPVPGEHTVEENLRRFVQRGLAVLGRVLPAFSLFVTQPAVMAHVRRHLDLGAHDALPGRLTGYLRAEQELGRIAAHADPAAVATLLIGACHELTLPRALLNPGADAEPVPASLVDGMVTTVLRGIEP